MTDDNVFHEIDIPFAMFDDLDLVAIDKAAQAYFDAGYIAISMWIGQAVEVELNRRVWNRANPSDTRAAGPNRMRLADWSDSDIADGLRVCVGLAEHSRNDKAGEFFDALGTAFVGFAGERLKASGDPRNQTSFVERNRRKDVNPEAY